QVADLDPGPRQLEERRGEASKVTVSAQELRARLHEPLGADEVADGMSGQAQLMDGHTVELGFEISRATRYVIENEGSVLDRRRHRQDANRSRVFRGDREAL